MLRRLHYKRANVFTTTNLLWRTAHIHVCLRNKRHDSKNAAIGHPVSGVCFDLVYWYTFVSHLFCRFDDVIRHFFYPCEALCELSASNRKFQWQICSQLVGMKSKVFVWLKLRLTTLGCLFVAFSTIYACYFGHIICTTCSAYQFVVPLFVINLLVISLLRNLSLFVILVMNPQSWCIEHLRCFWILVSSVHNSVFPTFF